MSRRRLALLVGGLIVMAAGIVLVLVVQVAWGFAVAAAGFALVVLTFPRLPADDDPAPPQRNQML